MAKRESLGADIQRSKQSEAAQAQRVATALASRSEPKPPAAPAKKKTVKTTAINIDGELYELLRRVAFNRAMRDGGRPSVSAILEALVREHRAELEADS